MADLMKTHDVKCHVCSVDISHKLIYPGLKEREDITFIQGDSFKIEEALSPDFLKVNHLCCISLGSACMIPHRASSW